MDVGAINADIVELVLTESVGAIVRWLHVIAGIAWIGSSFYFIHTDLALEPREGLPEGAHGETWQVHGGGFYNIVKFLVAPARMPTPTKTWAVSYMPPAWKIR